MQYQESTITSADGTFLFVRHWQSTDRVPDVWIVMTHGLGEHTARHQFSGEFFARHGYGVIAYDLRGHGRSGGRRGHVWRYDSLLADLECVRTTLIPDGAAVISFGHSFGGQVTLNYAMSGRRSFMGYVVTSPWLDLAIEPPLWKLWVGKVARWLCPVLSFPLGLKREQLAREPQLELSEEEDALMHRRVTAWMFEEVCQAAEVLRSQAGKMHAPLWVAHGAEDPVTSAAATRQFYQSVASREKVLKLCPGGRHELHNEAEREELLTEIVEWIDQRCPKVDQPRCAD